MELAPSYQTNVVLTPDHYLLSGHLNSFGSEWVIAQTSSWVPFPYLMVLFGVVYASPVINLGGLARAGTILCG